MSPRGNRKGGRTITVQVQLGERWVEFLAGAQTVTGMGIGKLLEEALHTTCPYYVRLLMDRAQHGELPPGFDPKVFDVGLTRAERKMLDKAIAKARVIQAGQDRIRADRENQEKAKRRDQAGAIFGDRTSAPDR